MSWITRCPDCDAVYKVESAQLQQAHGWLRCGTCQHVFDSTGRVVAADVIPTLTDRVNVGAPQLGRVDLERLLHKESPAPQAPAPAESSAAAVAPASPISAFEDALQSFKLPEVAVPSPEPLDAPSEAAQPASSSAAEAPAAVASTGPRSASRAAVVVVLALLAGLVFQLALAGRSVVLTHWPQWGRAMASLCDNAACRAQWQPPLSLWTLQAQPLALDGAGYRLSWSLTHAAQVPLSVPALELKLLNAQGQVVSRQTLTAAMTAAPATLASGQTWQGSVHLALAADLDATQALLSLSAD